MSASVPPLLRCASRSDIGKVRVRNEDAVKTDVDHGWLILADGMGGYEGGDVAAQLAVDVVDSCLQRDAIGLEDAGGMCRIARRAAEDANAEIRRVGMLRPELAGMGATLVLAVFLADALVCAHVGDSRLYVAGPDGLRLLTRDHTLLQERVDAGMMRPEDARRSRYRGMLTRGLGVASLVEADIAVHPLGGAETVLLCSDGLTDMLDDGQICEILAGGGPLETLADRLVDAANAGGGRDNVSVILARREAA
ncbi:PP2C family protein-serine/threonine phosphatase [Azoarcus olearius]|uniref:Phosphoprotein phosphatase n=1 Tax=Azoarcus sp. (strain BH72) TaxID=418699 RepID=A1KAU1_AZOSB|nr:protein phosphatase 2C domain-containing protein [Azoarcus olearius]CAL95947.1 putative phosphoprotein phosphatase [Azoarcus olearius]